MKILVAGGAGFIGSNLCLSLVEEGHQVTVIDDSSTGTNEEEISKVVYKYVDKDVLKGGVEKLFKNKDIIYNLIGKTSHFSSMTNPLGDIKSNILAPFRVLDLAKNYCPEVKIVFTGTRGQYGKIQYLPVDENHPLIPLDVNGVSKNAIEQYNSLYVRQYNMNIVSLRLTNIFGPRHQTTTPDGVLNWFITQARRREKISICGGDRDILFVDECVDALKKAAALDKSYSGQIFNIGGRKVSLEDYVKTVVKVVPTEYEMVKVENKIEIGDYLADCSKFIAATGWELSSLTLEEMINKIVEFYTT